MALAVLPLVMLLSVAPAYETDQLTDRHLPLADSRKALNQGLDWLLADAVREANARTRCLGEDALIREVLAREIRHTTARPVRVAERGLVRASGFTPYSAWIERTGSVAKRSWEDRDDLYGATRPWDSLVLAVAGPVTTVAVDGIWVGTDKFDHFLAFGYLAWRRSQEGEHPERVPRFGDRTERLFYGMLTSRTYSFADIAANSDGARFYAELLGPGSTFQRGDDGCVEQVGPFDWSDWVDWRWDEALNPSRYSAAVQERVRQRISEDPERYCAAREALGGEAWDAHLQALVASSDPAGRRSEARVDPYELSRICAGEGGEVGEGAPNRRDRRTMGG